MEIEAKPWPEIVEHYRNLVEDHDWPIEPMLALVRRIEGSAYSRGLVAYTSHATLAVARSPKNFWRGPELRIEFDLLESKAFRFTFIEREDVEDPWTRTAGADEGFEVLERFLVKRARWFRKPLNSDSGSPSPSSA